MKYKVGGPRVAAAHRCRESVDDFMKRTDAKYQSELKKQVTRQFKDIGQRGYHHYLREAWTFMPQSDIPGHKVLVVERLRWLGYEGEVVFSGAGGEREYRIGYLICRGDGSWGWGQYAQLIPVDDLEALLKKARAEGTIL